MNNEVELPACAAIQLPDGTTFAGERHHHCISMINTTFSGRCPFEKQTWIQGFMTTRGRFVTRRHAYIMRLREDLPSMSPNGYRGYELYSEDLY
jgi:hypothetical protein